MKEEWEHYARPQHYNKLQQEAKAAWGHNTQTQASSSSHLPDSRHHGESTAATGRFDSFRHQERSTASAGGIDWDKAIAEDSFRHQESNSENEHSQTTRTVDEQAQRYRAHIDDVESAMQDHDTVAAAVRDFGVPVWIRQPGCPGEIRHHADGTSYEYDTVTKRWAPQVNTGEPQRKT